MILQQHISYLGKTLIIVTASEINQKLYHFFKNVSTIFEKKEQMYPPQDI